MTEKRKKLYKNILFFVFLGLIFFTPLGMELKLLVSKLRVQILDPSEEDVRTQEQLSHIDYQWQLIDRGGKILSLEQKKGELILINYWATWCPPCVAEMPSFQNLYNDYGDKMTFIFLTSDNKNKVNAFLENKNFDMPVYYLFSNAPKKLSTNSLPTTFLIGKDGKILINEIGASDWNGKKMRAILDKYLKN